MQINLRLSASDWLQQGPVAVSGYCFDADKGLLRGKDLCDYFSGIDNIEGFRERLRSANGLFAVVVQSPEGGLLAATDISRSRPFFYRIGEGSINISDDAYTLIETGSRIHSETEREVLLAGYSFTEQSLIKGIFQLKPGYLLSVEGGTVRQEAYYSYRATRTEARIPDFSSEKTAFTKVLERVFDRLTASLEGRQVVVPLSGGYDSRLILAQLRIRNYPHVLCYTVGRPQSRETQLAQETARRMGYPHRFIDNASPDLIGGYTDSSCFECYYRYSATLAHTFWMYEYFGVKLLTETGWVDSDAVFVPGHMGDFLAGSQTSKNNVSPEDSPEQILQKLADYLLPFRPGRTRGNIPEGLRSMAGFESDILPGSVFDEAVWQTRYARFINNSARIYPFFGHEYRLPFADNEMLEFFRCLHPDLKRNKFFYNTYLREEIFEALKLNFEHELQAAPQDLRRMQRRAKLKKLLPHPIVRMLTHETDDTCMCEISQALLHELRQQQQAKGITAYNEIFVRWYLMKLKEELR